MRRGELTEWTQAQLKQHYGRQRMNADREQELVRLLRQLLKAYDSLMPGLAYIAVQDYEIINRAPYEARNALREWYPEKRKR